MVEDKNPSQDTVEITEHVVLQNVSYDKDVVEIKLPDADSGNYGGNFVKDVCVDEGALLRWKISEEKLVDKRTSPNYGFQMIDANSDIRFGNKDDARKPVHEIKPETVVPVDSAPPDWNEKQYSSDKEYDLEGRSTTCEIEGDPSDKKISLQELLRLESEEESRQAGTINFESTEKFKRPLHEDEVGQASTDEFPEVQAIGVISSSVSSKDKSTGCLPTTSPDHDAAAASDVREPNKIDRHNLFIDQRSLEETSEPECSMPAITGASSTESVCSADRTDSSSNVVSGSTGLNVVETAESGVVDALSSSSSDIQSCEKRDDHSGSTASRATADAAGDTAAATSSSPNSSDAEAIDANGEDQEKCASDGAADAHDSDQIVEGHCIDETDNAAGKSSCTAVQDGPGVEQTAPESSRSTAPISKADPFEPNFCSASIMSGPVSMSGHIAYSGSVSLRSESSTTSTRSFAFPVLQREWVSSPVRMAKAERRRTLRRRAWRKGLICCKF